MENWFEQVEIDERQAQFLQLAYRNTYVNKESGKQVLCHLNVIVEDIKNDETVHPEAKLMAIRMFDAICHNSGIIRDYKFIEAIAGSARLTVTENKPKTESEHEHGK